MVSSATQSPLETLRARRRRAADAAARGRGARGQRGRQDDHLHDPRRRHVLAAGRPRGRRAADVKYAIERSLLPGVPNGYVQTYLAGVEGIDEAVKEAQDNPTGGAPDISGITAPDDTTLEIKLTDTSSIGVIGALIAAGQRPGAGGVRGGVRRREPVDLRRAPGRDRSVHDRERRRDGELIGYTPNKEIHLVRNPNWEALGRDDFRPAYLDEITIQEGFADTVSAAKKILAGSAQVNGDFTAPPIVDQAGGRRPVSRAS